MADLYNANLHSSPLESEEMTSFLHNLIHKHPFSSPPQPPPVATGLVGRSQAFADSDGRFGERDSVMVDSSAGINFSDPGRGFMADARAVYGGDSDGITSMFKRKFLEESDFDEFGSDFTGPEASEAPVNPALPRSSKRTRAAEVHNLSEKRRRSRINEKMKALQKLIPNSNKTDKASMLDEVIEYLKQLQLQVQVQPQETFDPRIVVALPHPIPASRRKNVTCKVELRSPVPKEAVLSVTGDCRGPASVFRESLDVGAGQNHTGVMLSMRNGLSLHPLCFPESVHSALMPQPVLSFDEGNEVLNSNRGQDVFSRNQEISVQAAYDFPNQAPMTSINNSETSFGLEPSMQSHYGPFHHHSKELCHEDGLSQLQLDMSCSVKNSSSGVSS
ncbi:hypothetical protein RHSIM_Rhsim06G0052600 [Rhododendron simsii]|uniref:BHLH domain-containing protein n=1 Tax=Rhododendron simsii TaxID=118357 RepID=A0A834GTU1_RHOSS|nr:hypothetical protein RHSIM_Rhsim06G0052600 [Rhododendron simsii]